MLPPAGGEGLSLGGAFDVSAALEFLERRLAPWQHSRRANVAGKPTVKDTGQAPLRSRLALTKPFWPRQGRCARYWERYWDFGCVLP